MGVTKNKICRLKKWLQDQEGTQVDKLPTQDAKGSQNANKVTKEDINYTKIDNKIDIIIEKLERIENINNINNNEDITPIKKFNLAFPPKKMKIWKTNLTA